jgi:hypothetical protein
MYSAIGIKAACNSYCYNKRDCEIAFSALGASDNVVTRIGLNVKEYRADAYRITATHIAALEKMDMKTLSSEQFLREALPVFMRATYLRESVTKTLKIEKVKELDKAITSFLEEKTPLIARVFAGQVRPVRAQWREIHTYVVGVGVLQFTHANGTKVVSVVFPSDQQP